MAEVARLHALLLPGEPPPERWSARLAQLLVHHGIDEAALAAWLWRMRRHDEGAPGEPAVRRALSAPRPLERLAPERLRVIIRAASSAPWLARLVSHHRGLGLDPCIGLSAATDAATRHVAETLESPLVHLDDEGRPPPAPVAATLLLEDTEVPTPALVRFVGDVVRGGGPFSWAFRAVACRRAAAGGGLEYSQFLAFGPFSALCPPARLVSSDAPVAAVRLAPEEALVLDLAAVLVPFGRRFLRAARAPHPGEPRALAELGLLEAVPARWHLFAPLPSERLAALPVDDGPAVLDEAPAEDPGALRDRLVKEARRAFAAGASEAGLRALGGLRHATIDAQTLAATDVFLPQVKAGRRLVATCDPARRPGPDELVVIYGNYPHVFENLVVNNPMKRHVSQFGEFAYDAVEYDPRWEQVSTIYVLNGAHRADRFDAVMRELAAARAPLGRVQRVAAIMDKTTGISSLDGAIGCLKSHVEILAQARARGAGHVLVLEDDFCFTSDQAQHLDDLALFFERRYSYLVCLLATSKHGKQVPRDDLVSESHQPCTNTAAFLLSREGVEVLLPLRQRALARLLESHDASRYAADRHWAELQPTGRFLAFRRKFGFQRADFSDIEGRISRYLD